MSRCEACDTILNEAELRKIDFNTQRFLDLCHGCAVVSNKALLEDDLITNQTIEETLLELGFDLSNN